MRTVNPKEVSVSVFHSYLLGAIAPRPIAFASTIDREGRVNLSPFSFFNVFGSNPPTLIFSPNHRVRDNTAKHTLENVLEVEEVVINMVEHSMVEQMSLASCEYEKGVNEFKKAGFTPLPSVTIRPPRVAESPAAFECKVREVIRIGEGGGSPNLVICEVLLAHIDEKILDEKGLIDTRKTDWVARMGGDWYCRAHGEAVFMVSKPNLHRGIGVDQIPARIRNSRILTGNNLGRLGNEEHLPDREAVILFRQEPIIQAILTEYAGNKDLLEMHLHQLAQRLLESGETRKAWLTLLQPESSGNGEF